MCFSAGRTQPSAIYRILCAIQRDSPPFCFTRINLFLIILYIIFRKIGVTTAELIYILFQYEVVS